MRRHRAGTRRGWGPLTRKQMALIHVARDRLGLTDGEYRELIVRMFPDALQGSCRELDCGQASELIDYFRSRGFAVRKPRKKRRPRGVAALVTEKQLREIDRLARGVRWLYRDGLARFTKKVLGGRERPASTKDGVKLIEALKGLRETQGRKGEAHG